MLRPETVVARDVDDYRRFVFDRLSKLPKHRNVPFGAHHADGQAHYGLVGLIGRHSCSRL